MEAFQEAERVKLDDRRKAKLLGLEVQARIASANQKSWETPERELGEAGGILVSKMRDG